MERFILEKRDNEVQNITPSANENSNLNASSGNYKY
jgi:hypothetical protein